MDFLVIDDDKLFGDALIALIEGEGHYAESVSTGEMGLQRLMEEKFSAVLLDLNLGAASGLDLLPQILKRRPHLPVVMFTAQGNMKTAVEAMRRGAMDFLEKPFNREQFHLTLARVQRFRQLGQDLEVLEQEVKEFKTLNPEPIFDFSAAEMLEAMETLLVAAKTPASILIVGESGTGKTVMARAAHQQSHLADKPFVTVSCPSLSKELLQSELFGHVKGSFTGAVRDHWGKVKAAEGGTLFLDEVGDLPIEIQPKLLRLLQEREYERLGENVTRGANVRVIAATNRDLKLRMAEGAFREDLYFRLNVITVEVPPLRARPRDLVRFAEHYFKYFALQYCRPVQGFSDEAIACLRDYSWPGNLRELRNAVERAVILAKGGQLLARDFPSLRYNRAAAGAGDALETRPNGEFLLSLAQMEERHLREVLKRTPNLAEAAAVLGIDQATLYRKRQKIGLK